jgi:hypothetical protein
MLEAKIQELTTAVAALTAEFSRFAAAQGGKPTETQTTVETPVKKEEKAKAPDAKKDDKEQAARIKAIQAKGAALIKAGKQEGVKALLKEVGATTFTSIKPESLATVEAGLTKLETTEEAPAADEPTSTAKVTPDEVKVYAVANIPKASEDQKKSVQALVKKYGAGKVTEVPADKLEKFFPELKAIFETKEEASLV